MSHIKLTKIEVPAGLEWASSSYPGDGAYLTPNGLFFVNAGSVFTINSGNWRGFVTDGSAASDGVDVHRLLDQVISLARKGDGA